MAKELLEREIIFQSDLEGLIGKRPFQTPTTYQTYTNGTTDSEQGQEDEKEEKKTKKEVDTLKNEVKEAVEKEESTTEK